jgi:predicted Rdx family selenoprotein
VKAVIEETSSAEVELIRGGGGVFTVQIDGKLAYSKKDLGRFPEDAEVRALF